MARTVREIRRRFNVPAAAPTHDRFKPILCRSSRIRPSWSGTARDQVTPRIAPDQYGCLGRAPGAIVPVQFALPSLLLGQ